MKWENSFSVKLIAIGWVLAVLEFLLALVSGISQLNGNSNSFGNFITLLGVGFFVAFLTVISFYIIAQFLNFMYIIAKSQKKIAKSRSDPYSDPYDDSDDE